jgi:hypothetical protein
MTRLSKVAPIQVFTGHAELNTSALMVTYNVPVNAHLDFIKSQRLFLDLIKLVFDYFRHLPVYF